MKVTLDIEPSLVDKITDIAKRRNIPFSEVVEMFFTKGVEAEKEPFRMKNLDELADVVKKFTIAGEPVADFDHKVEYRKHLEEKYGS